MSIHGLSAGTRPAFFGAEGPFFAYKKPQGELVHSPLGPDLLYSSSEASSAASDAGVSPNPGVTPGIGVTS